MQMPDKILFIALQYCAIALFLFSAYGYGRMLTCPLFSRQDVNGAFLHALTACCGTGIYILALQILVMTGMLTKICAVILLGGGLVSTAWRLRLPSKEQLRGVCSSIFHSNKWYWPLYLIVLVGVVELALRPLLPPAIWDETSFHLPYAREWAQAGKMTIGWQFRYPLFPMNYQLLYALAFVFRDEFLPHILHSLAGWLTCVGIYGLAVRSYGKLAAWIGVAVFVYLGGELFANAYIDLALTMYVFFAFSCLYLWRETDGAPYLYISALLFGLALGVKHHAWLFMPLYMLGVLGKERKPRVLVAIVILLMLPCVYWYLRSYLISGNPVHPFAGRIFGYWGWSKDDILRQFEEVGGVRDWPEWICLVAFGALLPWKKPAGALLRGIQIFSVVSILIWYFTTHLARYLTPVYPALAILIGYTISQLVSQIESLPDKPIWRRAYRGAAFVSVCAITWFAVAAWWPLLVEDYDHIAYNEDLRHAFLKGKIRTYEIDEYLKAHPEPKTVQIGFESDMYYLPDGTLGDLFGFARYADFDLKPIPLAKRLDELGATAFLLSLNPKIFYLAKNEGFDACFSVITQNPNAVLFRLKKPVCK